MDFSNADDVMVILARDSTSCGLEGLHLHVPNPKAPHTYIGKSCQNLQEMLSAVLGNGNLSALHIELGNSTDLGKLAEFIDALRHDPEFMRKRSEGTLDIEVTLNRCEEMHPIFIDALYLASSLTVEFGPADHVIDAIAERMEKAGGLSSLALQGICTDLARVERILKAIEASSEIKYFDSDVQLTDEYEPGWRKRFFSVKAPVHTAYEKSASLLQHHPTLEAVSISFSGQGEIDAHRTAHGILQAISRNPHCRLNECNFPSLELDDLLKSALERQLEENRALCAAGYDANNENHVRCKGLMASGKKTYMEWIAAQDYQSLPLTPEGMHGGKNEIASLANEEEDAQRRLLLAGDSAGFVETEYAKSFKIADAAPRR